MSFKSPTPVDIYIGRQVRLRRTLLGMSQEQLAAALGITFQQIQKYEKGSNRISASRLKEIAQFLDTPFEMFVPGEAIKATDDIVSRFLGLPEGAALMIAFTKIAGPQARQKLVDLAEFLMARDQS